MWEPSAHKQSALGDRKEVIFAIPSQKEADMNMTTFKNHECYKIADPTRDVPGNPPAKQPAGT